MNTEDFQHRLSHRGGQKLVVASLALAGLLLAIPAAQATLIASDLNITGSVSYDTGYASSQLSGSGTQSGTLNVTQGGAASSSSFSGAAVTGSNPLNGTLTDLGDGFGFSGSASASDASSSYGIGIDIGLNLANNSATDTYKITFNIAFDNSVNSAGTAYAHSNFSVFDRAHNQTLFYTDLMSDALNGNENGGVPNGNFGGSMTESGPASFTITLLAGQSLVFDPSYHDLSWTLNGDPPPNSSSSASLDAFLSITSVEDLTNPNPNPNPNPAPEPATLALLGVGLAGLGTLRRRAAR